MDPTSADPLPWPLAEPAGSPPPAGVAPQAPPPRALWPTHRLPSARSAGWAAALGWLVPGLGQAYGGRWGAGLVLLLAIGAVFAGGLALTDFVCIDPRTYQLEFVAHALIGGPTAATLRLTQGLALERLPPWSEVGRLFVVVSGFLNLVAVCDAAGSCWRRNARLALLKARLLARSAAEQAPSSDPAEAAGVLARADQPATTPAPGLEEQP